MFHTLSEAGFDAHMSKFEWQKIESEHCYQDVSKLVYPTHSNEFYFVFDFDEDGDCYATYFPGVKIAVIDAGHHDM